jgi:hypothetical protein
MRTRLNLSIAYLSVLFFIASPCANAQIQDTAIYQYRFPGSTTRTNTNMEVYSYNSNCQYNNIRRFVWNSSMNSWDSQFNTLYTYTLNGILVNVLDQQWNNSTGTWQNVDQVIYSTKGSVETITFLSWNIGNNEWDNAQRNVDSRNDYGNLVVSATFLPSSDTWELANKTKYAYNDQQQQVGDLFFQTNGTWYATNKHKYNYTNNDLSVEIKGFWRSGEQEPWITFGRDLHNLLPVTKLESMHLQQAFYDNKWVNQYRDSFTYINNNKPFTTYHLFWNDASNSWTKFYIDQREYYKDGSLHYLYNLVWGHDHPFLNYDYKATFTHHGCGLKLSTVPGNQTNTMMEKRNGNNHFFSALPLSSTKDNSIIPRYILTASKAGSIVNTSQSSNTYIAGLSVSPNPAKSYFNIKLTDQNVGSSTLKITDMSGRMVLQKQIQNNVSQKIELPLLQKGMYIINVISGTNTRTQKLVVQ